MRCDGGQHLVAGQEHPTLFVVETEMVVGVPRGEEADPVPAAQRDVVAIGHPVRWAGRLEPLKELS